jgi:DNA N-6-adenine-methyltransferase (Dam)/Reverse transcriptase (RNA-dependent DNA polymerase)
MQPFYKSSPPATAAQLRWWLGPGGEADRLKKQGSLYEYPPGVVPPRVSPGFCVPKGAASYRLVVNAKHINIGCTALKCRYESLKLLQRIDLTHVFAIKVDLRDAYYQVPIQDSQRHFFAFGFAGRYYHLNCLPFGWLNSPWYFTKIAKAMVTYVRSQRAAHPPARAPPPPGCFYPTCRGVGAKVLPYLDDFLFVFADEKSALAGSTWVHDLLYWLGFTPHEKKCVWIPTRKLEHLGLIVDFEQGVFEVPAAKMSRLVNMAKGLLVTAAKHRRLVSKQALASFCGFAQSVKLAVACAQLFLRKLYDACGTVQGWHGNVRLGRQALADLAWWANIPARLCRAPIQLMPGTPELYVDASKQGWGAVMAGQEARGYFSAAEQGMMIAQLEMRAVRYALLSFPEELRGRCVLLREDNSCTEAIIKNACSKSPVLLAEFRLLWQLADEMNVTFKVVRVASADNLADAASRFVDRDDYKLAPELFQAVSRRWGPFDVDLFASTANAQLPKFFSATRCPGTAGVDALMQCWSGMKCYGNPPFTAEVMLQVVQKTRLEGAEVVLIVPAWRGQAWYQELMLLADHVAPFTRGVPLFAAGAAGSEELSPPPRWGVEVVHVPPRSAHLGVQPGPHGRLRGQVL